MTATPPRGRHRPRIPLSLRLLERLLLSRDDREFVGGDLEEDYWRARQSRGPRRAAARYAYDLALTVVWRLRVRVAATRPGTRRDARDLTSVSSFFRDVVHAARVLRRRPGFTIAAVTTLALGIGATTAVVGIARAVLFAPLPYPASERLVFLSSGFPGSRTGGDQIALLDVRDVAERTRTLSIVAAYSTGRTLQLTEGLGDPEPVHANIVDPEYLAVLGATAARGRLLGADERRGPNETPVVVVSSRFWQRRLGADPAIVGRSILLSDVALTVVGVLSPSFRDTPAEDGSAVETDVFIPVAMAPSFGGAAHLTDRHAKNYWALARLAPGVGMAAAREEVARIGRELEAAFPASNRGFTLWADPLESYVVRDARGPIVLLFAGSLFVLLIGCANVANLVLTHISARGREYRIRLALGASRWQVARSIAGEAALLAIGGALLGVLIARTGFEAFRVLAPDALQSRLEAVALSPATLALTAALAAACALLLALVSTTVVLHGATDGGLRVDARGASDGGTRVRRLLLVAQVACAIVLVLGATLMLGSLARLRAAHMGFDVARLATLELDLRAARYRDDEAVARFGRELLERLRQTHGVEAALLWGPGRPGRNTWVTFPGRDDSTPAAARLMTWRHTISPGALQQIGVPLLSGREFDERDTAASPRVAIVSRTLAETLWPGESAIGRRLKWRADQADSPLLTVVGVAADAKHRGRVADLAYPARDVYVPLAQRSDRTLVLVIRATDDADAVVPVVRSAVRTLDATLPVFNVRTMAHQLATEEAETRYAGMLMGAYAAAALLLAAIGVYGVLSYQVALRSRELAVRSALGASREQVVRLVVADGLRPTLAGVALGLGASLLVTRWLESLLYGVQARDPITFASVAGLLLLVALAATAAPARRASLVSPVDALRVE